MNNIRKDLHDPAITNIYYSAARWSINLLELINLNNQCLTIV